MSIFPLRRVGREFILSAYRLPAESPFAGALPMGRVLAPLVLLILASPLIAQGFSPAEAVKRMKLPPGFSARAVATEPMIRQPLSISFDDRGRLWVLQYLQYPNPAGLTPLKRDQYLRTVWDKVPEPPPKGPKGLDRITICYDPDEQGVFRKSKDFVSGLNLASGFCIGNKGLYVVQPPYLLYYADKNEDDVPDGDPEVLLSGFGLDDTHSLANSLQWGPDGWLYGAAGSTSTCKIEDPSGVIKEPIEFQQGVWRYHVATKRFELFSEGGGNTYGLDFDRHGQCITGTNWGGFAMLHQHQGAYYVKGFAKHGPLHNPFAYGYFDHVPYKDFKGGHVTCGGILYEADAYPPEFRGQYIAGNLLSNAVHWHTLTPKGASFTAAHGGVLLDANDTWFRPVDLQIGPDGCVYVADWYDRRAAHLDPLDTWDKSNGRVYKIEYAGSKKQGPFDLRTKSNAELVELLKHPNVWWRREARRLLAERPADLATIATLLKWIEDDKGLLALESLWTWWGFDERRPQKMQLPTSHSNEFVRAWSHRLDGDFAYTRGVEKHLDVVDVTGHARGETSPVVLAQIACSARRLPNSISGMTAICGVVDNPVANRDPQIRQLVWWALEDILTRTPGTVQYFMSGTKPTNEIVPELVERMARRLIQNERDTPAHAALADLIDTTATMRRDLVPIVKGVVAGMRDSSRPLEFGSRLNDAFQKLRNGQNPNDPLQLEFAARLGDRDAVTRIETIAKNANAPDATRLAAIRTLRTLPKYDGKMLFLTELANAKTDTARLALIDGLQSYDENNVGLQILRQYPAWSATVKAKAIYVLLSRPAWARSLFEAAANGTFPATDLTADHGRVAVGLNDPDLTKLVEARFGKIAHSTPGEKKARIDALNLMLTRERPGDAVAGKVVFTRNCAACHTLHGEGAKVGPDLTASDRRNRLYLLTNVVDPSALIRPEFVSVTVATLDGRVRTGMVTGQTAQEITLATYVNGKVESTTVARREIEIMEASSVSLMPEKLLDALTEIEIRDLYTYLTRDQ
jgi:putative membrane-bound dehydrogenase-like protein